MSWATGGDRTDTSSPLMLHPEVAVGVTPLLLPRNVTIHGEPDRKHIVIEMSFHFKGTVWDGICDCLIAK